MYFHWSDYIFQIGGPESYKIEWCFECQSLTLDVFSQQYSHL